MEVHRTFGAGFLERVYRTALAVEFESRGIAFANEVPIPIHYKGHRLPLGYRADFICFDEVLVEVKALDGLGPIEQAQVMNYLKAAKLLRAILLNFGTPSLQYRRIVRELPADVDPAATGGPGELEQSPADQSRQSPNLRITDSQISSRSNPENP